MIRSFYAYYDPRYALLVTLHPDRSISAHLLDGRVPLFDSPRRDSFTA